jgi:Tol biopolymer transport system component
LLGQSIGQFELAEPLGRGGAGEVYRAWDAELGRNVAIKCIPPSRLGASAAVSSFIREARAASSLNHPGIVTVYEVIRSLNTVAIVMELVEGEPFRKLTHVSQPLGKVAVWGQRIAEALAASHAVGIIHRDIKPENLMLRRDGYVKILDFGVAIDPRVAAEESPAGTFRYMSPEQAGAARLTPASDIFSLGIVLYELATGVHPFARTGGTDSTMTVAQAIAAEEARPPSALVRSVGGRFDALVMQMLARTPVERPSAAEVVDRLGAILAMTRGAARRRYWIGAAALVLVAAFGSWRGLREPAREIRPLHIAPFTSYAGSETQPSFSPDGSRVAFAWTGPDGVNRDIYVKGMEEDRPHRLTTNAAEDFSPSFSPDGKWVAFLRHTPGAVEPELLLAASDGGEERLVGRIAPYGGYHGMEWWPDSQSLLVRDSVGPVTGIVRVFLSDGRKEPLTNPPATFGDAQPVISPDGARIAFIRNGASAAELCVIPADGGAVRTFVRGSVSGLVWSDRQHLLYTGSGGLWLIGLDGGTPAQPVRIADGAFADLTVDRSRKRLAFTRSYSDINVWRIGPDGQAAVPIVVSSSEDSEPSWSPDGSRFVVRSNRSGNFELYTYAADGSGERQITHFGAHLGSARWSPDGQWIVFDGNRAPVDPSIHHHNVFVAPASGGAFRRLTDDRENYIVPAWSSDSRSVYYESDDRGKLFKIPLEGGSPVQVADEPLFDLAESPDGKRLYYTKYDGPPGIWQRPTAGGPESRVAGTEGVYLYRYWQIVGNGVFFVDGPPNAMIRALSFGSRKVRSVAPLPARLVRGPRGLAVSPEGSRILYTMQDLTLSDIMLADGWQ